jgi:acyl transferase domain-containing protein/NADPH:quinone reductase-like Zn-dependent oxidoreductase/acyl carrier protein
MLAWVLSARNPEALVEHARGVEEFLANRPEADAAEVAFALTQRAMLEYRAAVVGADRTELNRGLAALTSEEAAPAERAGAGRTIFVFPGQGSQWVGMGRELHAAFPVFAEAFDAAAKACDEYLPRALCDVVWGQDPAALDDTLYAQPALFAVEVGLTALLQSFGVRPDIVFGHSLGEITAAHVAGALTLNHAAALVATRARLMSSLPAGGAMIAIAAPSTEVTPLLTSGVNLSALNGPESVVISGAETEAEAVAAALARRGRQTKRLKVSHAFHSELIEPILAELGQVAATIPTTEPSIPIVSNVDGRLVSAGYGGDGYWVRHARQPVRFADSVATVLAEDPDAVFLEVGPGTALSGLLGQASVTAIPVLRSGGSEPHHLVDAVAARFVAGGSVDWSPLLGHRPTPDVDLPTYPFTHKRFWFDSSGHGRADASQLGIRQCEHPLLGAVIERPASGELVFTGRLSLQTHPWLADHAIGDTVLVPGAALVECALFAGDFVGCGTVEELVLQAPLVVPEHGGVDLQVVVGQQDADGRAVWMYSRVKDAEGAWSLHGQGTLSSTTAGEPPESMVWPPAGADPVDVSSFYQRAADRGYRYGPVFQGLSAVWTRGEEVFAEVELPERARVQAQEFVVHPALLDVALQAIGQLNVSVQPGKVLLPFSWEQVEVHAVGAERLRVWLKTVGDNRIVLDLYDHLGAPVATVGALSMRDLWPGALRVSTTIADEALFSLGWVGVDTEPDAMDWVDITGSPAVADAAIQVLRCTDGGVADGASIRPRLWEIAERVRGWLVENNTADTRLVVVTCGAVAVDGSDAVPDLMHAGVWGLLRTVQAEHPERVLLVDVDVWNDMAAAVGIALSAAEPQTAYRRGELRAPRLARFDSHAVLGLDPEAPEWSLQSAGQGTLSADNLQAEVLSLGDLAPTDVRIEVRAVGVNFRDVLVALGMYPDPNAVMGSEGAGVVTAVGSEVKGLAPGDQVFGVLAGVGSTVETDYRALARIPDRWNFAEAAGIPMVFLTAYYALHDLADIQPWPTTRARCSGQSILVHAATGGVGMATIALARAWGLEVFATASPRKWPVLRALGLDSDHIASSRDLDFEQKFLSVTAGEGMDMVLNSLANEYTDASLRLLPRGGKFVEMGLTDLRDPDVIAADHPGVIYLPFTLLEVGTERLGEILREVMALLAAGTIDPLPVSAWDVRRLPEVYRYLSQARHIGKITLTLPRRLDPDGTVLITGGTGGLGGLLARHLVTHYRVSHLLLISRRGPSAEGADTLVAELQQLGAQAQVVACDAADRDALAGVLADIPAEHPLTGVIHAAGLLRDGMFTDLTDDQFNAVLRTKIDAAWNLHALTAGHDLALFVLFSSAAGVIGSLGQANYAAANTYLDALAHYRQHLGLPATALAWGLWQQKTGMTGHLNERETTRMNRGGLAPITSDDGLALFDAALQCGYPLLVPARMSLAALAAAEEVPPLFRLLARTIRKKAAGRADGPTRPKLAAQLTGQSPTEQDRTILEFIRNQAAAVLGYESSNTIPADEPFKSLGFDSLTAVEFRNRLQTATGLKLPPTMVFDYPTLHAVTQYVRTQIAPEHDTAGTNTTATNELMDLLARLEKATQHNRAGTDLDGRTRASLLRRFSAVERSLRGSNGTATADLDSADDSTLFAVIDNN